MSPSTRTGVVRGRPVAMRGMRIPSRTWANAVASLTLAGVSTVDRAGPGRRRRGGPWWSARLGTGRGPGASASGPDLPVRPRQRPLFTCAGGVLVGTVDRGVDGDGPLHLAHRVVADLHMLQQPCPRAVRLPAGEPLVDRLARRIPLGQVTPRSPGPQPPQHTVDHLPVITPRPTTPIHLRQQGLHPLPRRVRRPTSTCHKINYQTSLGRPRSGRRTRPTSLATDNDVGRPGPASERCSHTARAVVRYGAAQRCLGLPRIGSPPSRSPPRLTPPSAALGTSCLLWGFTPV